MIDLIIPSYNDLNGLYATLFSLGYYADVAQIPVTIIDDASTTITKEDYNILIATFEQNFPIQVLYLPENKGPGYARQYGIDHTTNPFLLFMDAGNLFANQLVLFSYLEKIQEHGEQLNMLMAGFLYETQPHVFSPKKNHSEFHGTLLRRSFLEKHQLRISTVESYIHEDTPFVAACHIIAADTNSFIGIEENWTIRTFNTNSLTNKDNRSFYYKLSVKGFILNALEILTRAQIPKKVEQNLVYYYMTSGYMIYLDLIEFEQPQYQDESLQAIRQFYLYYQNYFTTDIDEPLLRFHIYEAICTDVSKQHYTQHYIVFDFMKFIQELEPSVQPHILK